MNGPNKTVAKSRFNRPAASQKPHETDEFVKWLFTQGKAGVTFANVEQAAKAYEAFKEPANA